MRMNRSERRFYYSIFRIVLAIVLLIVSVLAINKIVDIVIHYPYLTSLVLKEDVPSINITVDNTIEGEKNFINDDRGLRFRKDDKSFARDEWIDKNGELFYFDASSYGKNGDMRYDGQIYSFEKGKLISIKRDKNYSHSDKAEYFNSRDGVQFMSYLDADNKDNNNYPIKYFYYNDEIDDYLGNSFDKQYCAENLMKINNNIIYYLALGNTSYTGILNRMRPNAEGKETIGTNVVGYIVLSEDVVYYYNGNVVIKAKNWNRVNIDYSKEDEINDMYNSAPLEETKQDGPNVIITTDGPGVIVDGSKSPIIVNNNLEPTSESKKDEAIIGVAPGMNSNNKNNNTNKNDDKKNIATSSTTNKTNNKNTEMNTNNNNPVVRRDNDKNNNDKNIVATISSSGPVIDTPVPLPKINALPR